MIIKRTRVDSAGRVVIPKAIREACGIDEDTALEVRLVGREVRIIPTDAVPRRHALENGWVVFDTGSSHELDVHALVQDEYERRSRELTG
jgi:AbrB family looped-hinge helix DNA binding protein